MKREDHDRTLYFDEYTGRILQNSENKGLLDIPYSTLYKNFRKAGEQIGVDLTPHICRHTFATEMGQRTDPFTLARMLGHSVERVAPSKATGKYVHPSEEKIRELMLENHYLDALEVRQT